jgi:hypothetical protein
LQANYTGANVPRVKNIAKPNRRGIPQRPECDAKKLKELKAFRTAHAIAVGENQGKLWRPLGLFFGGRRRECFNEKIKTYQIWGSAGGMLTSARGNRAGGGYRSHDFGGTGSGLCRHGATGARR